MYVKKVKIVKENKFGDRYTIEEDRFVYEDEHERRIAMDYNRTHEDTYSDRKRKENSSVIEANMSQILDSIDEFFDTLNNLN